MVITIIEWVIFGLLCMPVAYLLFFAIASKLPLHKKRNEATEKNILVLFPAYKEDLVIEDSVKSVLNQQYSRSMYEIVVIADKLSQSTVEKLREVGAAVLDVNFENSSKAKALNFAMSQIAGPFDIVVILDADNIVKPDFLRRINDSFSGGIKAVQAHRTAKNMNTDIAVLDAISEEMSNSMLRKGHNVAGLSSALIGSGMAFDYQWFKDNVGSLTSAGEDKELEKLLLKQNIFIEYLPDVDVLDEKIQSGKGFYSQRRRWISAQFYSMIESVRDFPSAVRQRNINYCDKLFQWMMLPRVLLLGIIIVITAASFCTIYIGSIKWCILLFSIITAFFLAIPNYLFNFKLLKAFLKLPVVFFMMALNLLRIKGSRNKFYHTDHKM